MKEFAPTNTITTLSSSGVGLGDGLSSGDAEGLLEPPGLGDGLPLGEGDELGDPEGEGEAEALALGLGEALASGEVVGLGEGQSGFLTVPVVAVTTLLGEALGLGDPEGEALGLGEGHGLADAEAEPDGEGEVVSSPGSIFSSEMLGRKLACPDCRT